MPSHSTTRRYELDWVRILAFGLLILYHVGMYYVSWDWHVKSPYAGPAIEPLMFLASPWRLSLLFFVSGVATVFLLDRLPRGFLASRSRRLLLPLVFGMLVIVVPQAYYEVVQKAGYDEGYLAFWWRYLRADPGFVHEGQRLIVPTWNHLWFVAYLWCYTLVLVLLLKLVPPGARTWLRTRCLQALQGPGLLIWPWLLLALVRIGLVGRFGSTHALVDDWYNHAQYFSVFLLGFLLARAEPVLEAMRTRRRQALMLWLVSVSFLIWYFSFSGFGTGQPPPDAMRQLQRAAWALNQWTAMVAIVGYARQFRPGDGRARRYLTEAVFPFYILHQTAIVVYAYQLEALGVPPMLEGPLLVAATFATCLLGFELVRRVAWLRPLFGLKPDRTGLAPPAPGSSPSRA